MVGLAVSTLSEMSEYPDFMIDSTVDESVTAVDAINSLNSFSEVVKSDSRGFNSDYVQLLGNLMEAKAERAVTTQSRRMLQDGLSPSV